MNRIWCVYDHPRDYPSNFVARLFEVTEQGARATGSLVICPDLERVRDQMQQMGLVCIPRSDGDDVVIVESWI